ncbi:synaptic vesicle membrane protein VAT-1 homolog [Corythoichthys intestinalis]|uniref:synaptic vesicle membrane protein VAT-1 homolog n=1 Tax=Corythoichthys intestinalis TaxID=161448 RepID=UPI0025A55040|nr:synaptic vesicle membrane protein VAT-1 homolog [Corythoichthys intestinalis]XP_061807689.1 synaptic vesicle membrane protein VAT-1 homolog [Nerophis lumbriciformis]
MESHNLATAGRETPTGQGQAPSVRDTRFVRLDKFGAPSDLIVEAKQLKSSLQPGEVQVRVEACGLNFADLMGVQGLYPPLPKPPVIMGMECAGTITAVGEEAKNRKVGERVIGMARHGMWQQYVALPENNAHLMPDSMSFEEGAALPISYLTAYMMLFRMANLTSGKSVLIHMAAGGVGIAATQLCKTVPDVTVFGTASASKHQRISEIGVTHPIDYRTKDYVEEIRKISPTGVDIVLDPLGGADSKKGFDLLKPFGSLITFGAANCVTGQTKSLCALIKTWRSQLTTTTLKLMQTNKAVCGFHLSYSDNHHITACMAELLRLYSEKKIKPCIDSRYHFEEVTKAMQRMHERKNIGKIILLTEPKQKLPDDKEK